jgi:hypothetical protein
MKKSPDHERLLRDTLGNIDDFRAKSLEDTLTAVRGVHRMRRVRKGIVLGAAAVLTLVWALRTEPSQPTLPWIAKTPAAMAPTPAKAESSIRFISDDELLDEFQGRAVALVGPTTNRRLVFLDVKGAQ